MDNSYISELKDTNEKLVEETNELNNLVQEKVLPALEICKDNLIMSGLNYEEIKTTFDTVFKNTTSQINELTSAMNDTIIPKYEQTAASIAKIFNQDFVNEMNNYMSNINN